MNLDGGITFVGAPYVNSLPLMRYLADESRVRVLYDYPSALTEYLEKGEADAALVPIVQWFSHPEWVRVQGLGIASSGPVRSVLLRCNVPPEQIKTLAYDSASNTSNWLAKWILKKRFGVVPVPSGTLFADAEVVIGDRALNVSEAAFGNIDLAQAWNELTHRSFVFAVWAVRKTNPNLEYISRVARMVCEKGLNALYFIAKAEADRSVYSVDFWMDYLSSCIRYVLTDADEEAILYFRKIWEEGC